MHRPGVRKEDIVEASGCPALEIAGQPTGLYEGSEGIEQEVQSVGGGGQCQKLWRSL